MRTIVTRIALSIALAISFGLVHAEESASAAHGISSVNNPSMERAVMHQINKFVAFPLEGDQERMYGVVEVAFVVNSEGRLVILSAGSGNEELCDYVVRKLAQIHGGPNPSGLWNTSRVRFTFLPEA